jgi:hypothetical protein
LSEFLETYREEEGAEGRKRTGNNINEDEV